MTACKDYKSKFIHEVEERLVLKYNHNQVAEISNIILKTLSDYDLTKKCTDIAVLDEENEKLIKKFSACLLIDGKSKNTIAQYVRMMNKLSNTLNKHFTEMGTYDIRFFLAIEKDRGVSNVTLENTRAYISSFFQWMVNDEIIPKNPIANIKPIKCNKEIKLPFSEIEIDAIRGACKTYKERALVEFLLSTGVRVSELTSMEVKDISINNKTVHVVHGKGGKERITYMNSVSIKHLQDYLNNRKEDGVMLFYNRYHTALTASGVRCILNSIGERANVENVHPHRFRRTFATRLSKRGMDIQEIMQLLGHSDIDTTLCYVTVNDDQVRASYQKYIS